MLRDDLLIGGDDVLAPREGRRDELKSRILAANQLDDNVDFRIANDIDRIRGKHPRIDGNTPSLRDVAHRDVADDELRVDRTSDVRSLARE